MSRKKFRISGTGCALVDYLYKPVHFDDPGVTRYLSKAPGDGGLAPGKLVFRDEFETYAGEPYLQVRNVLTAGKPPVSVNIGGPSVVSLIHAAQMLHNTDAEVTFSGARGSDDAADFIMDKLKKTPLVTKCYKTGSGHTPFTDVLSDPDYDEGHGERVFINDIGAAREFSPEDLSDSFFRSDMVVFGGTALVPGIHASLGQLLKKAKKNGALTVVNTVYDFLSEKNDPVNPWKLGESAETYRFIDILITDMEEALRLSGTASVEEALSFFRSSGVGATVVTHGAKPLHFYSECGFFGKIAPSSLPVSERVISEIRINPETAGDTTGCGDNFAGGLIASAAKQLMENPGAKADFYKATALAVVSGGFTCFYHGGTYYEMFPGQKKDLLSAYYQDYLAQTGIRDK